MKKPVILCLLLLLLAISVQYATADDLILLSYAGAGGLPSHVSTGAGGLPSQVSTGAGGWNSTPISSQTSPSRPSSMPAPPVPYPYYPYATGPYGPVFIGNSPSAYPYSTGGIYHYGNSDALGILSNPEPVNYPPVKQREPYQPYGPPTDTTFQLQGTLVPGGSFILLKFDQNGREVGMKIIIDEKTKYLPEGYQPKLGDKVTVIYFMKGLDHIARTIQKIP